MAVFKRSTRKNISPDELPKNELGETTVTQAEIENGQGYLHETSDDVIQDEVDDYSEIPRNIREEIRADTSYKSIMAKNFATLSTNAMLGLTPSAREDLTREVYTSKYFSGKIVQQSELYARYAVDQVVGIKIIPDILAKYPNTTDINLNGRIIFVDTGSRGTGKIAYARLDCPEFRYTVSQMRLPVIPEADINRLIQFFAGRENKQFNEVEPIFNGFVDNIRVSAMHRSLCSTGTTMSLRISRAELALNDGNFEGFAPADVAHLLKMIAEARVSLAISGETGTGKTELLKYYVQYIRNDDRININEDVSETQLYTLYPQKDVVPWHTAERDDYDTKQTVGIGLRELVKQSLRSYPRFVAVSEIRGVEAFPTYSSMTAGQACFFTIHCRANASLVTRFIDIIKMYMGQSDEARMRYELLVNLGIGIHIVRKQLTNGRVIRYADEIVYFDEKMDDNQHHGMHVLFNQRVREEEHRVRRDYEVHQIPDELRDIIEDRLNYFRGEVDQNWIPKKKTLYEDK